MNLFKVAPGDTNRKMGPIDNNLERIKKLQELSKKFSAVQEIKGDGNCYYRAIIRGYIGLNYRNGANANQQFRMSRKSGRS